MKAKLFLSILPLILLFACSVEDPGTDPPNPVSEDPLKDEDSDPPSVPEELRVSEVSFETLTLSWKASSDNDRVEKYLIFLNQTQVEEATTSSISLQGLSPGSTLYLSVAAADPAGNTSERSEALEVKTLEDLEPPGVPQDLNISEITETAALLSWSASHDNAAVKEYDILMNGEFLATNATTEFTIQDLAAGTEYQLRVLARDIYGNSSEPSEVLEFSTKESESSSGSSPEAIFLSEYIEGSSNNKALELANLSGAEIDLSSFSLKKISNENSDWSDERKLEGKLAHGDVFVMAHSKAMPAILEVADVILGGGVMDFNGNDTVGLFKNGELIDIIGTPGGENFAKDVTLRRKNSVTVPKTTYSPEDWEILEIDTVDGLGKP